MRKSSQAISLVLIGTTFLYFGCSSHDECDQPGRDGQPAADCSGGHGGGGAHAHPISGGSGASRVSGTRTGGFGSHGASFSAGA